VIEMEEDYEDFVLVTDLIDEVLKERLLREGFKKIPLVTIIPAPTSDGFVYRVNKRELPERVKQLILERVAEKKGITIEEAEKIMDENDWFIGAKGAGTRNIYKYIL